MKFIMINFNCQEDNLFAVPAKPEEFKAVVDHFEGMLLGFGVLEFLDGLVFKFDDFAALHADKVVMVLAALRTLIEFLAVTEVLLFEDLAFP